MDNSRLKTLASNIRAERHRKGISQEFLSEKINISTRSISAIENAHQMPSALVLYDIAQTLEIDINVLLKDV